MGGLYATFMYKQVISEAPLVDDIMRGEDEGILTELMLTLQDYRWPADRHKIRGIALAEGDQIVATPAASTVKDLDGISPD